MNKFLYIDDASSLKVMYPADSFRGSSPTSDTTLELYFTPLPEEGRAPGKDNDIVELTITANKHKDVLQEVVHSIFYSDDYLIAIFDSVLGVKISTHIGSVARTASSEP
tara:strand:- start:32 stop:358 length:327 start_codon:yes stop_codon:yes gene_type:complete